MADRPYVVPTIGNQDNCVLDTNPFPTRNPPLGHVPHFFPGAETYAT
jgi:hypothetical protein